jgi:hypothetical protein
VPSCLSHAAQRTHSGKCVGLQPYKTTPFVGYVGFSTKSKNQHTPLQSGLRHAASEQAVAYLRKNMKVKRFTALQSEGLGGANLQQVSPVLCAACARQKTHGAACHGFAVGFVGFSTSSKKPTNPTRMRSVREPGSLTHPQVTPIEGCKPPKKIVCCCVFCGVAAKKHNNKQYI